MSKPLDLDAIRARAEAATAGPWRVGTTSSRCRVNDDKHLNWTAPASIPKGECALCYESAPVRTYKDATGAGYHIHLLTGAEWRDICSAQGVQITGNYDYEDGGVCSSEEDATFIAHARTDIPAMADEIERLRGLLREARPHVEGDWTPDCIGARDCKCGRCGLKRRIDAALAGDAQ